MSWYDTFSRFYDASLENLYRDSRTTAIGHLGLAPGSTVFDLACGTGQNFDLLREAVGPDGRVVGIDLSEGMLGVARERIARGGWDNVEVRHGDVADADLSGADAMFCALGFSTFPDWEGVLDKVCAALPGGAVLGIFDVRCERWNPQTTMVALMAQADLYRPLAEGLEARTTGYAHHWIPGSPWVFGGRLFVATGRVR
ncbi:MAG: class I SAM-dependent methyltransferase [Alphaproteobacteria bacterium]|nr:class I SAM-dependent methyltransferase [Alphaproteobacteria bacterium]